MPEQASPATRVLVAFPVCAVCALDSFAQTNRGAIAGTVFDPTGAAIPNATVSRLGFSLPCNNEMDTAVG